ALRGQTTLAQAEHTSSTTRSCCSPREHVPTEPAHTLQLVRYNHVRAPSLAQAVSTGPSRGVRAQASGSLPHHGRSNGMACGRFRLSPAYVTLLHAGGT